MIKTAQFAQTGGPEQLQIVELPPTEPAANEVQVDIKAAGLNRAELMFMRGGYLATPKLPSKIGWEGSGIVTSLGKNVTDWQVGDEVVVLPDMPLADYGVLAERTNVPASALIRKPESMSFIDAAAFWVAYTTAWGCLIHAGGLSHRHKDPKPTVLVAAASSSVGLAAIRIAQAYGATVIATTRNQQKQETIAAQNPDHIIVTEEQDLLEQIDTITGGQGIDIALDPISGPFLSSICQAANREATIVEYGLLSGKIPKLPFTSMMDKGLTLKSFDLALDILHYPERSLPMFDHLLEHWQQQHYKPVISAVYPFDKTAEAYRQLSSDQHCGKIIVELA